MKLQRAIDALRPEDLFPIWCWVDGQERTGRIDAEEAARWKHGIFELMMRWGVEPDRLSGNSDTLA